MPNRTLFYPQITPEHLATIQQQGFKTIINNRPDDEEINQPKNADIEHIAKKLGLQYHFLPVISGQISQNDVEMFANIFNQAEKPVFIFCRSGTRSRILFQMAEQMDLLD